MQRNKDRLVGKFRSNELQPIKIDNRYHSPEVSETDNDNPGTRNIVIKDLKWRSSTVSLHFFLTNQCIFIYLLGLVRIRLGNQAMGIDALISLFIVTVLFAQLHR